MVWTSNFTLNLFMVLNISNLKFFFAWRFPGESGKRDEWGEEGRGAAAGQGRTRNLQEGIYGEGGVLISGLYHSDLSGGRASRP